MKCKKTIRGGGGGKKEEEDDDDDDNDRERGRRRVALAKTKQTKREELPGDISYLPPGVDFWAAPNIFLIKSIAVTRG